MVKTQKILGRINPLPFFSLKSYTVSEKCFHLAISRTSLTLKGLIGLLQKNLLVMNKVTAGYPGHLALKNITFQVDAGEAIAIVGPNGGGKSTLLKVIMGLLTPFSGEVLILGENPYKNRLVKRAIAYLPQQSAINPHFPALIEDIVQLGLYSEIGLLKPVDKGHQKRIHEALEQVDMLGMLGEPYEHLSGGQKQRVLIARALVSKPQLLLLDEPTTGLDLPSQKGILQIVKNLTVADKLTVIAVTHDQFFLQNWAERILRIEQVLSFNGTANSYFERRED